MVLYSHGQGPRTEKFNDGDHFMSMLTIPAILKEANFELGNLTSGVRYHTNEPLRTMVHKHNLSLYQLLTKVSFS